MPMHYIVASWVEHLQRKFSRVKVSRLFLQLTRVHKIQHEHLTSSYHISDVLNPPWSKISEIFNSFRATQPKTVSNLEVDFASRVASLAKVLNNFKPRRVVTRMRDEPWWKLHNRPIECKIVSIPRPMLFHSVGAMSMSRAISKISAQLHRFWDFFVPIMKPSRADIRMIENKSREDEEREK